MDKTIRQINTKWVEQVLAGKISQKDAELETRIEVENMYLSMGMLDEAIRWKWLILKSLNS